uniref:Rne n=1 Tax=Pterocladia lucida TaxID=31408 RepID=A0A6M3WWK3_PTELU|nr:rne [Pterocladia lucida]
MIKKIVISHFNNIAAILQNTKIQEIILVKNTYQVNDIYIGTVQKIFSSINAAFITLGKSGKSGFIHINDIKCLKRQRNINRINDILSINQLILVQIVKEPTLNKGPRLTANINLFGKYITLIPFGQGIQISHKIYDLNERSYLYSLALLLKPITMGLLIKPSAIGISEEVIIEDLKHLKNQWNFIKKSALLTYQPQLIYKDKDLIKTIVRDFYNNNIKKIIIDSAVGLKQLNYFFNKWKLSIVQTKLQLYNKQECILEQFNIKEAIFYALQPKVNLSSGGYIIIESNEALTVIDVNSGSFNKPDNSKETILRTNFYAAIEIAYQLKVRNINGVIIIDFIDMQSQRDQLQLLEHFSKLLKNDNSKPRIVQLSELGLVELTRRRRGQSLQELCSYNNKANFYLKNCLTQNNSIDKTQNNWDKNILIYKNINTLFFNKIFNRQIKLHNKRITDQAKTKYNHKSFLYYDYRDKISLLKLKANYIAPLILYSKIVEETSG